jgi:transcriptional regulator CtsR
MAGRLGCVPSQISYVLTSRFTPERGYLIESRRGGGGYIRIVRKKMHRDAYLMHFFYAVGDALDEQEGRAYVQNLLDNGLISEREAGLILSAIGDSALAPLTPEGKRTLRANIFKHILLSLM